MTEGNLHDDPMSLRDRRCAVRGRRMCHFSHLQKCVRRPTSLIEVFRAGVRAAGSPATLEPPGRKACGRRLGRV